MVSSVLHIMGCMGILSLTVAFYVLQDFFSHIQINSDLDSTFWAFLKTQIAVNARSTSTHMTAVHVYINRDGYSPSWTLLTSQLASNDRGNSAYMTAITSYATNSGNRSRNVTPTFESWTRNQHATWREHQSCQLCFCQRQADAPQRPMDARSTDDGHEIGASCGFVCLLAGDLGIYFRGG